MSVQDITSADRGVCPVCGRGLLEEKRRPLCEVIAKASRRWSEEQVLTVFYCGLKSCRRELERKEREAAASAMTERVQTYGLESASSLEVRKFLEARGIAHDECTEYLWRRIDAFPRSEQRQIRREREEARRRREPRLGDEWDRYEGLGDWIAEDVMGEHFPEGPHLAALRAIRRGP